MPALMLSLAILAVTQLDMPKPPVAKKEPHVLELHGEKLIDNYFWLRNKDTKPVLDFLNGENAFADASMKSTAALQETLYSEMLGRIKQTDLSVPRPEGGYMYYNRTEEGKQYQIYCRKKVGVDKEEILLDVNELAKGQKFMSVASFVVSDDGNLLAYSTDNTGFRQYKLHVKDLRTGKETPGIAERVTSVVWAADNKTLFYGTEDATTKRSDRIFRMPLGGKAE